MPRRNDTPHRTHVPPPLTGAQVADLPYGTAVAFDTPSKREHRIRGRLTAVVAGIATFHTPLGEREVPVERIRNARVIESLYVPGDPVVLPGVDSDTWRGGVIRTDGRRIYVRDLDGYSWLDETEIEHADARVQRNPPPRLRRGPVPKTRL